MFPHVAAAFCLISFVRSRRPRRMMGKITARLGASIEFTNVVSMSVSRHVSVSFCGSLMARMIRGSIPTISAFRTQPHTAGITRSASALTRGCVSKTHSRNAGNTSGSVRMKYAGTRCARSPHTRSAPCFACQLLCAIARVNAGANSFIAVSGSAFTTARVATSAACRASADWSPRAHITSPAAYTACGSNCLPAVTHRCA